MAMSDDDATKRSALMAQINDALADVAAVDKRVRDAKSALGTAKVEQRKVHAAYTTLVLKLNDRLPKLDADEAADDASE
jgi:hypothetical protein